MNDFGNGVHAVVMPKLFGQFWRKREGARLRWRVDMPRGHV